MACPASGGTRPSHDNHKLVKPNRKNAIPISSRNGSSGGSHGNREMVARPHESDDPKSDEDGKGVHPRRWSPEEDERLRASVDRHHGTNWKDIAADVKSRNHVQCLQRWKKVLTPGLVKGQWSREEDELLTAVFNEGHKNWGALAARIPGRTSKQCRERWCHHLDPRIVKGKWTAEEDQTIVSMHREMGNKWATIAQHLDGRTENATKIRWKILERSIKGGNDLHRMEKIARGSSCRQGTDARLRCLAAQAAASAMSKANDAINPIGIPENPTAVQSVLEQNFRDMEMARHMPFANGCNGTHVVPAMPIASNTGNPNSASSSSACGASLADAGPQERELDCRESKKRKMPGGSQGVLMGTGGGGDSAAELKKGKGGGEGQCGRRGWLPEEDERLRQAVGRLGEKNWRYVAQSVSTRTHIQCQQRWKKALRPGLVKGAWSLEEDENLVTLIAQGFTNWSELATHTPGRTAKQCRERWCHHLDPSVNHGNWTQEEDALLCSLETRLGTKWAAIAREMPGRTEHAVKGRFKTLSREKRVGGAGVQISQRAKDVREGRFNGKGRPDTTMPSAPASQQPLPLMGVTVKSNSQEDDIMGSVRVMLEMVPSPLPMQPPTPCVASKKRRVATANVMRHASAGGCGEFRGKFMPHQQQQQQQQGKGLGGAAHQQPPAELELRLDQFNVATINAEAEQMEENNGLDDKSLPNEAQDAVSIARLLSVSSMGGESTTLSDVTSGCCGSNRTANSKNASLASSSPQNSPTHTFRACFCSADEQQQQQQQSVVAIGKEASSQLAQKRPGANQSQSRAEVDPRDTELSYTTPEDKLFQSMSLPKDPYAAKMGAGPLSANYSVSEASSLVAKPSVVDYSDLASILIDGFDVCKDGVGADGEFVTLGEDPYSDYSLTESSIIMQYPLGDCAATPPEHPPPRLEDQDAGFPKDYDDILGIPSDLTEALAAGVFDAEDPCDPYF